MLLVLSNLIWSNRNIIFEITSQTEMTLHDMPQNKTKTCQGSIVVALPVMNPVLYLEWLMNEIKTIEDTPLAQTSHFDRKLSAGVYIYIGDRSYL